jgi:hypothetical protein
MISILIYEINKDYSIPYVLDWKWDKNQKLKQFY